MKTFQRIFGLIFVIIFLPSCISSVRLYWQGEPAPNHTKLGSVGTFWELQGKEGVTRRKLANEKRTPLRVCKQERRWNASLELKRVARMNNRGGNAVVNIQIYKGRYQGGHPYRRLKCWIKGTLVHIEGLPGGLKIPGVRVIIRRDGHRVYDSKKR
ncbi:MAG: hypothetical protein HQ538_03485 [Parcubacteria group bacterium]|nr:hypothetical protein [Parcubacteria group bacterium]